MDVQQRHQLMKFGVFLSFIYTSFVYIMQKNKKDNRISNDNFVKAEYVITNENDHIIRSVKPYIQEFKTFAKGRWLGREVIDVVTREFGGHPKEYWINAIEKGHVRINNEAVSLDYKFRNSDVFLHRTHRHEPPVFGEVKLVGNLENFMAVCKPQSLPMHPCGGYRHNSLEYILKHEKLIPDQPSLHIVHRLDRVTSGLIVLAKNKESASIVSKEIRDKETKKVYLARVKGRFPAQLTHIRRLDSIDFASVLDDDGDEGEGGDDVTTAAPAGSKRKSTSDGVSEGPGAADSSTKNSNADNNPAAEGDGDEEEVASTKKDRLTYKEMKRAKFEKKQKQMMQQRQSNADGSSSGAIEPVKCTSSGGVVDAPHLQQRSILSKEVVGAAANVGYKWEPVEPHPVYANASNEMLWLQCPVIVISHRDGICACDPEGKTSISSFRSLGYCETTDTTLVECNPYTGRTHQLRLHLQFLGNPIANDPCYGGQLFYHDEERRTRALDLLREMRRQGSHPLSKVPHFNDPELDGLVSDKDTQKLDKSAEFAAQMIHGSDGGNASQDLMQTQREGETDNEYLVRTCRYCRDANACSNLEYLLHCDGIWLHALRYTGKGWSFETEYPEWSKGF